MYTNIYGYTNSLSYIDIITWCIIGGIWDFFSDPNTVTEQRISLPVFR